MKNILFLCVIAYIVPNFCMEEFLKEIPYSTEMSTQERNFFEAVQTNNIEKVKELVTHQERFPWPAFTWAIKARNKPMVKTLLDHAISVNNFDIDTQDKKGNTPLMLAVKSEDPVIVQTILAEVPNYKIQNKKGKTALDFVQKIYGDILKAEISSLLYSAQPQFDLYNAIISSKSSSYIQNFITPDISFYIKSIERNPLAAAIRTNNSIAFKLLIALVDVNHQLKHNLTPLMIAVDNDKFEMVDALLQKKANPNAITSLFGDLTPIHLALFDNDHNLHSILLIRKLVEHRADVNWPIQSNVIVPSMTTPLMMAVHEAGHAHECVQIVKEFLNLRADPTLKNSKEQTALDIVREKIFPDDEIFSHIEVIEILEKAMQDQLLHSDTQALHKN